jgi:hypothetical protein
MHQSNRTALAAALLRAADPFGQFRHASNRPLELGIAGLSCNHDDANLFLRDWRDVGLCTFAPVDFHAVGPGPHAIVAPRGVALCATPGGLQPAPLADAGCASIGSQNPASRHNTPGKAHSLFRDPAYRRVPEQSYSGLFCFLRQQFVQKRPPNANSATFLEIRRCVQAALDELNSAESVSHARRQADAEPSEGLERVWHQAFPAGLIDRRFGAVRQCNRQPFLARCDCRCQPGRAATDNEYVRVMPSCKHSSRLCYHPLVCCRCLYWSTSGQIFAARRAKLSASVQNEGEESASSTVL